MRSNLILLGGVAAVVAGVFSFCVNGLFALLVSPSEVVPWPVTPLLTLAGILTTLLYALGLVGLYALLDRRSPVGVAGLGLAFLAFLATLFPWVFGVAHVLYQIAFERDGTITNPIVVFPQFAVGVAETSLLAGAVLLVGLAALRSGVLGPWSFAPPAIALLTLAPLFSWSVYSLGFEALGSIPVPLWPARAPLWVLLGIALWRRAEGPRPQNFAAGPA